MSEIKEHMKIIGKDGAPVGTVDGVEGDRIKLTKGQPGRSSGPSSLYRPQAGGRC